MGMTIIEKAILIYDRKYWKQLVKIGNGNVWMDSRNGKLFWHAPLLLHLLRKWRISSTGIGT